METNISKQYAADWNHFLKENPKWAKTVEKEGKAVEKNPTAIPKEAWA